MYIPTPNDQNSIMDVLLLEEEGGKKARCGEGSSWLAKPTTDEAAFASSWAEPAEECDGGRL